MMALFVPAEFKVPERLDARLSAAVRNWIANEWPLEKVAYPGRDIEWAAWRAIPDEER